jgi:hypothetical protein
MSAAKILAGKMTGSSKRASALKIPDVVAMVADGHVAVAVVIVTGSVAGLKLWKTQVTTLSSRSARKLPTAETSRVNVPVI